MNKFRDIRGREHVNRSHFSLPISPIPYGEQYVLFTGQAANVPDIANIFPF